MWVYISCGNLGPPGTLNEHFLNLRSKKSIENQLKEEENFVLAAGGKFNHDFMYSFNILGININITWKIPDYFWYVSHACITCEVNREGVF